MKKLIALVLALAMVATLGLAFATGTPTYSITVTNTSDNVSIAGKTYSAYKLFDMTYTGSASTDPHTYSISSTDWAWNYVKGTEQKNDQDVGTGVYVNSTYGLTFTPTANDPTLYMISSTMTAAQARSLADALESHLPSSADGSITVATGEESATIELTEAGYYLVYGTAAANDDGDEVVAALALTSADPTATVNPKVEVPPLNKKITGQHVLDDAGKAATAQVGTTVSFELDSKVPDLTGYSNYTYTISDTMSSGLDFTDPEGAATNDIVVKINNVDKTSECTVTVNGRSFTVTIPFATLSAATKGQDIVVTYSAVLNDSALTTNYEQNTAKLTYSHSPYDTSTNETPESKVYVIDVDINVDKVAGSTSGSKLSGAKFKVFKGATQPADTAEAWYKWDDTNKKVTWVTKDLADEFVTGNDGKFTPNVRGLEAEKTTGTTYGLLETEAPTGYNLLPDPVIVTLTGSLNGNTATVSASGATVTNGTITLNQAQTSNQPLATATVINNAGTELPSTGGIGTTIFYILGGLLVVGAAVILVARRRVHE